MCIVYKDIIGPALCGPHFGKWCSGYYLCSCRISISSAMNILFCWLTQITLWSFSAEWIHWYILSIFSRHSSLRWHEVMRKNLKSFHFIDKLQGESDHSEIFGLFRSLFSFALGSKWSQIVYQTIPCTELNSSLFRKLKLDICLVCSRSKYFFYF